ncbi:MAG TPA: tRNA (cytidine(34)-2'-O)-methyltransferase [Oligoflexia bacterium]|mgnify:CR=1 FL=1|nr:tRNA (cytidine(34)-2'-O)-methyltransferase [Oligoflexia bacterium]
MENQKPPFHYHLVLVEPEIPPNTGNAGRLCVATQSTLHIAGTPGFSLDDKDVRRAGLDYWKHVDLKRHESFEKWLEWWGAGHGSSPFFLLSKKAKKSLFDVKFPKEAAFVFGKETLGLPESLLDRYAEQSYNIPMFSPLIRSLNLSNAVSIVLYEAIRQNTR